MTTPGADAGWTRFATVDRDAAHEWISGRFPGSTIRGVDTSEKFGYTSVAAPLWGATLTRVRYSGTAETRSTYADVVFLCHLRAGHHLSTQDGREHRAMAGSVYCLRPDPGCRSRLEDVDLAVLTLPSAAVRGAAADILGERPPTVTFTGMGPVSAVASAHLLDCMGFAYRTLQTNPEARSSPLVAASVLRLLASSALAAFPNTAVDASGAPRRHTAASATVRRAVAYIESNATRDLTLADIATAARVTPRALQFAFRHHLETTPLGYLRQVRLAAAHRDLEDADPAGGETVGSVAARWGFPTARSFATAYRRAYGRTPSRTLQH